MSEKIFAWLLKLYPLRFREEYGASAMQLFRDRLQPEQGLFKRFRLWLDIITDLAVSVPREHSPADSWGINAGSATFDGSPRKFA